MRGEEVPVNVYDAVRTVLAVRAYDDRAVPDDVVRRIVDAGRLTGSSMNKQPWHFIVVRERATLERLGTLVRSGPYIAQAPLAIAVAIEKDSAFGVSDASRAVQSMVLTAWQDGVASNWAGFGGLEGVEELLGVPAAMRVLVVVPFGYPAQPGGRGKKQRKPLGDVASAERYGRPFS
jgi:nitroreductase